MITKLIFIFLIALSFAPNVSAQWVQTNGPYGGSGPYGVGITCFAAMGTSLFSGTQDGVYRSTDSGTTWTWAGNGLPNTSYSGVTAIAVVGTNLFAGTSPGYEQYYGGGVFRSTDSGKSWTAVNNGLTDTYGITVTALAVSGTNLFVAVGNGVFVSTDNGGSWIEADYGLNTTAIVIALTSIGTGLFAETEYGSGVNVFFSSNIGESWIAASSGLPGGFANSFVEIGANLFAGTGDSGVYLSTNNGFSWVPAGLNSSSIGGLAAIDSVLFAGTANRVFSSSDLGESWTLCSNFPGLPLVWGTNLFVYKSGAVFLSTNNGASWSEAPSKGLASTDVNAFAVSGTNLFAAYSGGISSTTDNGASWVAPSLGLTAAASLAVIGTNIFAGNDQGVFLSTDNGVSFFSVSNGLTNDDVTALVASGDNLFAGTEGFTGAYIFRSSNDGSSWTAVDSVIASSYGATVGPIAVSGDNIFAVIGTYGYRGVYLSTNNGLSWSASDDSGLTALPYLLFGASEMNLFAVSDSGVFISTNNGTSWTLANAGLPEIASINGFAVAGTNVFVGNDSGVFLSTDNGTKWNSVSTGLRDSNVLSLAVCGNNLFVGTSYSGVWRRPLSEMLNTSAVETQAPVQTSLTSYPNPFTQSTTISFTSHESGAAEVTIVNLLGTEVARLFPASAGLGELSAGEHTFTWNAANMPPGAYWAIVRMNGASQQIPIVLQP